MADMTDSKSKPNRVPPPKLSLVDRLRESFEQLGYPQLNAVECSSEGDELRLSGELNSFYLKQVAQSVAVKIPGVREVHNEIKVR